MVVVANPGMEKAFQGVVRKVDARTGYVYVTSRDNRQGTWVSAEKVQLLEDEQ